VDERGKLSNAALSSLFAPQKDVDRLLPDVVSIQLNTDNAHDVTLFLYIPMELTHFAGHFPELPILPGVVQIDWAVYYARKYLNVNGEFKSMENVKFQAIVLPETNLTLRLEWNQPKSCIEFSFLDGQRKLSNGRIIFGGVT